MRLYENTDAKHRIETDARHRIETDARHRVYTKTRHNPKGLALYENANMI